MRRFRVRLGGFIKLIFFSKHQLAKTNAKTPHFCRNVNEPLEIIPSTKAKTIPT